MEDGNRPKTADWAPGTLDQTRRAIGSIDPAEAKAMSKILGGEVMYERSNTQTGAKKTPSNTGRIIRNQQSSSDSSQNLSKNPSSVKVRKNNREKLPSITQKLNSKINKLMMSAEYEIKPNYGLFNFVKKFQKNGDEQVVPEFITITLKKHIENMEKFITDIKTLIQIAPSTYKSKIVNGTEPKFKFLRLVAGWKMQGIKLSHLELLDLPKPFIVSDLINFVRQIYKPLIQVYYYGETKIPKLIKEVYADESQYQDAPHEKLSILAKESITQWLFIQNEVIKRLYPLLMRMCSDEFVPYPDFFKAKVSDILKFVGLHKYDLLLPEKPKEEKASEQVSAKKVIEVKGAKDEIVNTGLSLLEKLFPEAGFSNLENFPDMYPYFQPLYKFSDGFNVIPPENPMQVTVVLMRIVEDCFRGCRNIKFVEDAIDKSFSKDVEDSMSSVRDDWANYREIEFEKLYCEPLNDLVNQIYTQKDFEDSNFGKKLINRILWQTYYSFLPNFKFQKILLETPQNESKLKPIYKRTDFARKYLTKIIAECDAQAKNHGVVNGISNPWEHYKFDIQNEVSKRLDVLLGAKNSGPNTNANNANLLKYTLCFISVLDWWINNPESPAYKISSNHIYRVSDEDGKPQFSVPVRTDQNKLFVEAIQAAYKK